MIIITTIIKITKTIIVISRLCLARSSSQNDILSSIFFIVHLSQQDNAMIKEKIIIC